MSKTITERHYRDRMESLKRLIGGSTSRQECQDLVALCVELSTSIRDLIAKEFDSVFKKPDLTLAWLAERRQAIEELSDEYVQLAVSVKDLAVSAGQGSAAVGLDQAINGMIETKRSILERWLVGSPEEMAESRAAIARGETFDAAEAFADIAGMSVEAWKKSVDDYKQREQRATGS